MKLLLCIVGQHAWETIATTQGKSIEIRKVCRRCRTAAPVLWRNSRNEFRKLKTPDVGAFVAAEAKRQRKQAKRAAP